MRHVLLAFFAIPFFTTPSAAQEIAWANKLVVGSREHDFGVVKPDAQLKHTFKLTNIYKVPLDITAIKVSCGCVTVEPSSRSLQPTESATLSVVMDTRKVDAPTIVRIYITVGPKDVSTATLTVSANPRSDVVITPQEIDFGAVSRGQTPNKQVDVEYVGKSKDWRVVEIRNHGSSPYTLKAEHLPAKPDGSARKGFRLIATMKADAATGSFKQPVTLKTNDAARPVITFDVLGKVQGEISLSQEVITFNDAKVGSLQTKKVIVKGANPFRILKVEGQAEGITVDVPTEKNATQVITVNYLPGKAGDLTRPLIIRTDLNDASVQLTVECRDSK
jgi:hypothetical protein